MTQHGSCGLASCQHRGSAIEPKCAAPLQLVLAASAVLGLTINHSTFLCTQVNEPLMTSVAGNLKNVLMVRADSKLASCCITAHRLHMTSHVQYTSNCKPPVHDA